MNILTFNRYRTMKIRNSILLPAVCLLCSCSSGNEKMDKASCAEAFAEAYGLVRWFYPGDMPEAGGL